MLTVETAHENPVLLLPCVLLLVLTCFLSISLLLSWGNVYVRIVICIALYDCGWCRKEKITTMNLSRRDCIRKFSYHEIFCDIFVRGNSWINIFKFSPCFACSSAPPLTPEDSFAPRRVSAMLGHLRIDCLWSLLHAMRIFVRSSYARTQISFQLSCIILDNSRVLSLHVRSAVCLVVCDYSWYATCMQRRGK